MSKRIGDAREFYRVRVTVMDDLDDMEFDWRADILWRTPTVEIGEAHTLYAVEIVSLDSGSATIVAAYPRSGDAYQFMRDVEDELNAGMTASQFEQRFLGPDDTPDVVSADDEDDELDDSGERGADTV